jgi:hypothetical protein
MKTRPAEYGRPDLLARPIAIDCTITIRPAAVATWPEPTAWVLEAAPLSGVDEGAPPQGQGLD